LTRKIGTSFWGPQTPDPRIRCVSSQIFNVVPPLLLWLWFHWVAGLLGGGAQIGSPGACFFWPIRGPKIALGAAPGPPVIPTLRIQYSIADYTYVQLLGIRNFQTCWIFLKISFSLCQLYHTSLTNWIRSYKVAQSLLI